MTAACGPVPIGASNISTTLGAVVGWTTSLMAGCGATSIVDVGFVICDVAYGNKLGLPEVSRLLIIV